MDIACTDGCDELFSETSGVAELGQAVYRRLTTPRGRLIDDADYGFDVRELLHAGLTPDYQSRISSIIRAEVLKDERVVSCDVTSTYTDAVLVVSMSCGTADGPFSLTVDISEASVLLVASEPTDIASIFATTSSLDLNGVL